jgi:Kinetochore CENP-C fungal homologue, Mif2, N-terminal
MVKDTGRRDSAGLEDMDAFFSPTTPRKGGRSPGKLVSSYKTKLQAAMQFDSTVSRDISSTPTQIRLTSGTIQYSPHTLASRKSLLAQRMDRFDRTDLRPFPTEDLPEVTRRTNPDAQKIKNGFSVQSETDAELYRIGR